MNTSHYLAVDLGATSGRTILATYDGQKIEMKELTRFKNPMIPMGGHLYWDLPGLYNEVLEGLKKVAVGGGGVGCAIAYPTAKALHNQELHLFVLIFSFTHLRFE